ncbi:hypothetical protein CANCADRAFT_49300 [Tortispora caseinolytica NRRL Y-17796]|uniref:Protein transport protein SEC31 n=1 Tax=Tortispora caseinolytica NRRL Y-17796 TaxID=767744 RepID=A0A1E4TMC3_9ASCO|nr:hypothetical protein CANCADRAFT_49300 [Tortispora caseinolytica NRRL Y-17796]
MTRFSPIPRLGAFAWSPSSDPQYIATASKAGAIDSNFTSTPSIDLWDVESLAKALSSDDVTPVTSVPCDSQFSALQWSPGLPSNPQGILLGALETGQIGLWDGSRIVNGMGSQSLITYLAAHSGPVKSIDFNQLDHNLFVSGAAKDEVFIWDFNHLEAPIKPSVQSIGLDTIESVAWNSMHAPVLATGSSTGFASIFDLRQKREILRIQVAGAAARGAISAVSWNPTSSTKLLTGCASDAAGDLCIWDLRNASSPEHTLKGHTKGVLSAQWCKQDPSLLLSCGMDDRTIIWNPITAQMLGEYSPTGNWEFQVAWNPVNPNTFATASYQGSISVRSLQNLSSKADDSAAIQQSENDFWQGISSSAPVSTVKEYSLTQPPKWLKRPVSATFGFGGKIPCVLTDKATGKSVVKISNYSSSNELESTFATFESAMENKDMNSVIDNRIAENPDAFEWQMLKPILELGSKFDVLEYIGYNKPVSKVKSATVSSESAIVESELPTESLEAPGPASVRPSLDSNGSFDMFPISNPEHITTITKYIISGMYEDAVDVCLENDMLTDAFAIANLGGDECQKKASKAYFDKYIGSSPHTRILCGISLNDLADLVREADLYHWKDILAVIVSHSGDKFKELISILGDRLNSARESTSLNDQNRRNALICYLSGNCLDRVVDIWLEEMKEKEDMLLHSNSYNSSSAFDIHVKVLQELLEKVVIYKDAVKFQDPDLNSNSKEPESYTLRNLYQIAIEYADIAAEFGHGNLATKFAAWVPANYPESKFERERITKLTEKVVPARTAASQISRSTTPYNSMYGSPYGSRTRPNEPVPSAASYSAPGQSSFAPPYNNYTPARAPAQAAPSFPDPQSIANRLPNRPMVPTPSHTLVGMPESVQSAIQHKHEVESHVAPPPKSHFVYPQDTEAWNDLPPAHSLPSSRRAPASQTTAPTASPFPGQQPMQNNTVAAQTPPMTGFSSISRQSSMNVIPPPPKAASLSRVSSVATNIGLGMGEGIIPDQAQQQQPHLPRPPQRANGYGNAAGNVMDSPSLGPSNGSTGPLSNAYAPPPVLSPPPPPNATVNPAVGLPRPPPAVPAPASRTPSAMYTPDPSNPSGPGGGMEPFPTQPLSPARSEAPAPRTRQSTVSTVPKHPRGDRTHIPPSSLGIYEVLSREMERVVTIVPPQHARAVKDAQRRLNILFDHLNNSELSEGLVNELNGLIEKLQARDYDSALAIQIGIQTERMEECGQWMVGVKRLLEVSRAMAASSNVM